MYISSGEIFCIKMYYILMKKTNLWYEVGWWIILQSLCYGQLENHNISRFLGSVNSVK
jgi:hypothetical protein